MNVVHPKSVAFDVNNIVLHSFALLLTLFAVGATLFHVQVLFAHVHVSHCASIAFTDNTRLHGSPKVLHVVAVVVTPQIGVEQFNPLYH